MPPIVGSDLSDGSRSTLSNAEIEFGRDEGWQAAGQNVSVSDPLSRWVQVRSTKGVPATVTTAAVAPTLALDVQVPACTSDQAPSVSAAQSWLHQRDWGYFLRDPVPLPNPEGVVGGTIPPCATVLGWKPGWISPLNPDGWFYAEVVPAQNGISASGDLALGSGRLPAWGSWHTPSRGDHWVPVRAPAAETVLRGLNRAHGSGVTARRAIVMQPVLREGGSGLVDYVPAWAWVAVGNPMQPDQSMTVLATPAFRGAALQ